MKRFTIILLIVLLTSCQQYLNVQPQGKVLPKTDEEFAAIMDNRINDIEGGEDEYVIGNMDVIARLEGCADNLDANIKVGNITAYAGDNINRRQNAWRYAFEIIRDCNIVIENLEDRTTETAFGTLTAAYAMKAICYYNLLREYCQSWDAAKADELPGLPLVEKFDISDMTGRSSMAETAEWIDKLFIKALEYAPKAGSEKERFFFTEKIIKAYRAKLLFWAEDWSGCASVCQELMDSGLELSPYATYASVIQSDGKPVGEIITRSHINNASELNWYFDYVKGYIASRPISAGFMRLFKDQETVRDVRYDVCVGKKRMNGKLPECRLRVSEIVLMLAECNYHLGNGPKALEWLNELRKNRLGSIPEDYDLSDEDGKIKVDALGNPVTPLLMNILNERRKELFMEGDRWYELKRNGCPEWWIINNGLKYTTREYLYTSPIYKGDVDMCPDMVQNPGY